MSNPLLENLQLKQSVESAQKDKNEAAQAFSDQQINYKKDLVIVFEKMGLYSAGIISLSVTFLGYLLSQDKALLGEDFLYLPAYYYLYISWVCLLLNLVISLFFRWADSSYLFYSAQLNYHKRRKEFEEKRLLLLENYPVLVFEQGKDKEGEIKICNDNIETLEAHLIPKVSKKESKKLLLSRVLEKTIIVSFILGIIFLLIFAVRSTYLLINVL